MMRRKKIATGFTLIELLVVVIIIGVLVVATYPNFEAFVTRAKLKEIENTVPVISAAEKYYLHKNGAYIDWGNWQDGYADAEAALRIILPKGSSAICEYQFSTYANWIQFRHISDRILLGYYDMDKSEYVIFDTKYKKYLSHLTPAP